MPLGVNRFFGSGVSAIGMSEWTTFFEELQRRSKDYTAITKGKLKKTVLEFLSERFESNGAYGGRRWHPLTKTTLELKKKIPPSPHGEQGILRTRHALRRSFTSERRVRGAIRRATKKSLTVGSSISYAHRHQEGWLMTAFFGKKLKVPKWIPARPVVPRTVPREELALWEKVVVDHLLAGLTLPSGLPKERL